MISGDTLPKSGSRCHRGGIASADRDAAARDREGHRAIRKVTRGEGCRESRRGPEGSRARATACRGSVLSQPGGRCDDREAAATGLPAAAFPVEYINGAGNSLVIVPVNGASLIFTNVTSASGARYAAGQYIWWDAAGSVNFYSDSLAGKKESACHRVDAK